MAWPLNSISLSIFSLNSPKTLSLSVCLFSPYLCINKEKERRTWIISFVADCRLWVRQETLKVSKIKVVILSGDINGISWLWRLSDIESFAYRQNQWSSALCATSPQVAVTFSGSGGAQLPDKRDDCHLQRSDTCMCNTCRLCFNSSSAC